MGAAIVERGVRGALLRWDERFPLIAIGAMMGSFYYTLGENAQRWGQWLGARPEEWLRFIGGPMEHLHLHLHHHALHNPTFHFMTNEIGMWVFFNYLGLEIILKELKEAGKVTFWAVIGGMVIPVGLTYFLTQNFYIAIGAAATDVAFSLGALKLVKGKNRAVLVMVTSLLLQLAVGDDLLGVGLAAAIYAAGIVWGWMYLTGVTTLGAFFFGERGYYDVITEDLDQRGKVINRTRKTVRRHIEIDTPGFWWALALINTLTFWLAGIHWVIGGCIVLIFAPTKFKHEAAHKIKPWVAAILFFFGISNGALDLDPNSGNWGWMTLACFAGGMGGKQLGIGSGALFGRWLTRRVDPNNRFAKVTGREICALALFGSVNGTVAIFFVTLGAATLVDGVPRIPAELANQAILGYFLTVPAVYVLSVLGKLTKFIVVENQVPATA